MIKALPLAPGDVVTGDAAFAYRPVIEALGAKGADYFVLVKANQPELQAELAHAFGDDPPHGSPQFPDSLTGPSIRRTWSGPTIEKAQGRIETRRIAVRDCLPSRIDRARPDAHHPPIASLPKARP